jgi:hypothetical protein
MSPSPTWPCQSGITICQGRRRFGSSVINALAIMAAMIFVRVALFTFLDATWWVGGYERYLFPVAPLYSCFLILLIYQSLALWRRARQAI